MVLLLAVPGGLTAESNVAVSIVDVDDAAFPRIEAVVTADIDGRPLDKLDVDALRVLEGPSGDAVEARVVSITPAVDAGTPLALVLAIDASGSMAGEPITEARAAAASMIESLASGDSAAIVSFANDVEVLQDVTTDRPALFEALDRLDAVGNTTLYDAVAEAAARAAESGYRRRAVVLLSDGQDFGGLSSRTSEQSLEAVTAGHTVFYVVGYGDEIDRPFLEAVAERSGGRFFLASGTEDIATVYSSLERLLRSQLVVTFESGAPASGAEREVEVRVAVDDGAGAATRAYTSSLPAPTPVPTPAARATVAPTPAAPPAAGGSASWLPFGLAALVALGVVAFVRRGRSRTPEIPLFTALDDRPLPADIDPVHASAPARLDIVAGPSAVNPVPLGTAPITVGSGAACTLRLPAAPGVAVEHARIWSRDGRHMLHHIADGHETLVNGTNSEWASLGESDEVQIGPYVIRYRTTAPDAALVATTGGTP
jgi:VWFA-related protein